MNAIEQPPQLLGWLMFQNPDGYGAPVRVYISRDGGSYISTFIVLCYPNGTSSNSMHTRN